MRRHDLIACGLAFLASTASAQVTCGPFAVTVTPNPAPYGQTISVELRNTSNATVTLASGCLWVAVHAGSPGGPSVSAIGCPQVLTPVPAGAVRTQVWNLLNGYLEPVGPGQYWIEINRWVGGPVTPCTVPVTITPCTRGSFRQFGAGCGEGECFSVSYGTPSLNAHSCPAQGSTVDLVLARGDCNVAGLFLLGASDTAWAGGSLPFTVAGCSIHVSPDIAIIIPTGFGGEALLPLDIPINPGLSGRTVYVQAGTLGSRLKMSNALALTIE